MKGEGEERDETLVAAARLMTCTRGREREREVERE
jgi:hypothetical protein